MKQALALIAATCCVSAGNIAAERQGPTLESLSTNIICRVTVPEERAVAELAQGGYWLSFKHTNNPSGWGRRLLDPQESVFVMDGLVVVAPDYLAFDFEAGNPRNLIRSNSMASVAWGKARNGLAVGLKVRGDGVLSQSRTRLEVYLRNTSQSAFRIFACPCAGRILQPGVRVKGPKGRIVSERKGDRVASIAPCTHSTESDWPILPPDHTIGPLHFSLFTSRELPTVFDLWFDCSSPGDYEVSLEYLPRQFTAPARVSAAWKEGPSLWQDSAISGTVVLHKP
jgi:hypothetical protein